MQFPFLTCLEESNQEVIACKQVRLEQLQVCIGFHTKTAMCGEEVSTALYMCGPKVLEMQQPPAHQQEQ